MWRPIIYSSIQINKNPKSVRMTVSIDVVKVRMLLQNLQVLFEDLSDMPKDQFLAEIQTKAKHLEFNWFELKKEMQGVECLDLDAFVHSFIGED